MEWSPPLGLRPWVWTARPPTQTRRRSSPAESAALQSQDLLQCPQRGDVAPGNHFCTRASGNGGKLISAGNIQGRWATNRVIWCKMCTLRLLCLEKIFKTAFSSIFFLREPLTLTAASGFFFIIYFSLLTACHHLYCVLYIIRNIYQDAPLPPLLTEVPRG